MGKRIGQSIVENTIKKGGEGKRGAIDESRLQPLSRSEFLSLSL